MTRRFHLTLVCNLLLMTAPPALTQPLTIYTLAGSPIPGATDAFGAKAKFNVPLALAADASGNVYVADAGNSTIRKVSAAGMVSTLAGQAGNPGSADGVGTNAHFNAPQGICLDTAGNVYVADTGNSTIRRITPFGVVSTYAGAPGSPSSFDGTAGSARFYHPQALAADHDGNLYVADTWNHTIRRISAAGQVSTLAGLAREPGAADGTNSKARFNQPAGLALDNGTNLFVTEFLNHTIRKIAPDGRVTTIAGLAGVWGRNDGTNSRARFYQPSGIAVSSSGQLTVVDSGNHCIRRLSSYGTNWLVSTVAGLPGEFGNLDGEGTARFCLPAGTGFDPAGNLLVADSGNNTLRTDRPVSPLLEFGVVGDQLIVDWPASSVNFALEQSPAVANAGWAVVTNGVTLDGERFLLRATLAAPATYYRLHQR